MEVRCTYCREPVETDAYTTYQRVEGFEQKRSGGGANQIIGRTLRQEWACLVCINKLRRGIDPSQVTIEEALA